jgi:hypothetical protein
MVSLMHFEAGSIDAESKAIFRIWYNAPLFPMPMFTCVVRGQSEAATISVLLAVEMRPG